MGAVYKARQPGLDRLVAVKILPPEIGTDPAFTERFMREARALAKLSHQNIVSVFDFGQTDGQYYFIMEFVDGANLRHVIETCAIKPEEALAIVPQICAALQFAHDEGIIHRDIKPENILVDKQGRVKIADFGLAKLLGKAPADFTLTGTHQAMGTLHYMAPEQMQGAGSVDHRADIFSLGVVFYELLTGQLPIGKFDPPSKKVQVDVRLDEIVLRALESEPERRYQQVSDVKTDVESIFHDPHSGTCPAAGVPNAPARITEPNGESIRQLLAGPVAALTLVAVAGLALGNYGIVSAVQQTIRHPAEEAGNTADYYLPALTLFFAIILLIDAIKMSRCERYEWAVGGSVVAIILAEMLAVSTHVALLLASAAGIWAFVVLSRPEVQAMFRRKRQLAEEAHAAETATQTTSQVNRSDLERRAPRLLAAAIGIIVCIVVMIAGGGFLAFGLLTEPVWESEWWGWIGGAIACGIGGLIGLRNALGQYSRVRQGREADGMPNPVLVAVGFVVGLLLFFAGLGLPAVAVLTRPPDSSGFRQLALAGTMFLFGGLACLVGTWHSYRRFEGAPSLLNDPHWNRVDTASVGFGLLGVVSTLVLSPSLSDRTPFGVLIFGGPIVFAASVMLVQRWLLRRAARTETVVAGAGKDNPNGTAPL